MCFVSVVKHIGLSFEGNGRVRRSAPGLIQARFHPLHPCSSSAIPTARTRPPGVAKRGCTSCCEIGWRTPWRFWPRPLPDRFPPPPKPFHRLHDLVQPSLQAGLQRASKLRSSEEELNLTVLASPDHSGRLTWNTSVHLSSYTPRSPPTPAQVAVLGSMRDLPLAKYSRWATDREMFENAKPLGAAEIVLSNDGDGLLEGSATNLFVVAMNPDVEVQTAPLCDGVLPGVIRQLVIGVCGEDGIPVQEVMPSWQARGNLVESFVTSSLRMVQPVASVRGSQPWVAENCLELLESCECTDKVRFEGDACVTKHIRSRVLECALDEGVTVLEFLREMGHISSRACNL